MTTQSKQKKLKGGRQKLKLFRANDPLKSVLMWGINHSITTLQHVKPRAVLLKDDFKAHLKIKVKGHLFNKENMPSRFKFKEYCPLAFQDLRKRFHVDTQDYWESFTRYQPLWDSVRGKSGSKFLVTYNRHFVIKSISSEEVEQMHHFIENYHEYVVNCHGQTLLPQYLGLYRITVNDQESYLLAMRNVFSPRVPVHRQYNLKYLLQQQGSKPLLLSRSNFSQSFSAKSCNTINPRMPPRKGSVVDRDANEKEKSKPLPTLKDNDFLHDICKIHVGDESKDRLLQCLKNDIAFLQENNLMDYSVLIGIHDVELLSDPVVDDDEERDRADHPRDPIASAGDGLGHAFDSARSPPLSVNQNAFGSDVGAMAVGSYSSSEMAPGEPFANASVEDDYYGEEEEDGKLSDEAVGLSALGSSVDYDTLTTSAVARAGQFSSSDSPEHLPNRLKPFTEELSPNFEFYGIPGSPILGRPVIYFVALIDILTRYGMRKRTAQTYKTVKHGPGSEISTVRPEVYGPRLFEFISQCVD